MGLLAPALLAGLAALGLPVYLHLLKQHKTTPRPFSSLMFFERRVQSSIKHRRLKYRLLFALRAAFVALLVFAFTRPFLEWAGVASAHEGRVLALVIDDSFSMQQGDRLARAKQAAMVVARGMHGADRAQVITFGGPTRLITNLTSDRAAVENGIRSIEPQDGASSLAEAARIVRSVAQAAGTAVEAHVFSDFQKTSAPSNFADLTLPPGAQLILHEVANDAIANVAVERVAAPHRLFNPKSGTVQATLMNYSPRDAVERVALTVNGRVVETKPVSVPAGSRASVEFTAVDVPYGLNRGEILIDAKDGFPLDDHAYFAVERSDPSPALFIEDPGGARSELFFETALRAAKQPAFSLVKTSYAQAANTGLDRFAFIVLSDPPPLSRAFESALNAYVRQGGGVLVLVGRNAGGRVPVADLPIQPARGPDAAGSFQVVSYADATHPALRVPARWNTVRIYREAAVQTGAARVLLGLDNGAPLLLETAAGQGRVLVMSSALDNLDNDLPVRPLFVPFVQEVTNYLGRAETATGDYTAGAFYDLHPGGNAADNSHVEATGPNGERVLSLAESTKARTLLLEKQGFYDIRRPNGRHELAAVNPDRRESDFTVLPEETLRLWKGTGAVSTGSAGNLEAARQRNELWWWVLLAALFLAVAESLLGNRHLSNKEGAEPA